MTSKLLERFEKYRKMLSTDDILIFDCETKLIESDDNKTIYTHLPKVMEIGASRLSMSEVIFVEQGIVNRWLAHVHEGYLFVGHNVMFDVLVDSGPAALFNPKLMVWDTMKAAYLLSDQTLTNISLDALAEHHGFAGKDQKGSEMMKAGICPSTWPRAELEEYLKQDVIITRKIFEAQLAQFNAKPKNWQNMFINHMFYLVETTRASMTGMAIDKDKCEATKATLHARIGYLTGKLQSQILSRLTFPADCSLKVGESAEQINPMSNDQIAKVLYGGSMDFSYKEPAGTYKTGPKAGTCKYKNAKVSADIGPFIHLDSDESRSVDEERLDSLIQKYPGTKLYDFCIDVLELRDCSKTLNTYLEGYMDYAKHDGMIHTSYNHTTTPTKRLTCSKPNLQNIKGD